MGIHTAGSESYCDLFGYNSSALLTTKATKVKFEINSRKRIQT